jgi:hypothetical protein
MMPDSLPRMLLLSGSTQSCTNCRLFTVRPDWVLKPNMQFGTPAMSDDYPDWMAQGLPKNLKLIPVRMSFDLIANDGRVQHRTCAYFFFQNSFGEWNWFYNNWSGVRLIIYHE